ncbi:hypothetical protein NIES2101_11660 [Calothrix sp. HK-06]|nr:hypothetical protein NIES2101_11660 [Calothrix sp. HK-06]
MLLYENPFCQGSTMGVYYNFKNAGTSVFLRESQTPYIKNKFIKPEVTPPKSVEELSYDEQRERERLEKTGRTVIL